MIALLINGVVVMRIKELIREAKAHWDRLPKWGKLYGVFTTIVTLSSIASISDGVYKWKSFFLVGIKYYRFIVAPIKNAIHSYIGISLSNVKFDIFVLCCLFVVARRRFVIARFFKIYTTANYSTRLFVYSTVTYQIALGFLAVGLLLTALDGGFSWFVSSLIGFWILLHITYPFAILGMEAYPKDHVFNSTLQAIFLKEFLTKKAELFISYYGHIVVAIILLLIFAAINEGMIRQ